MLAAVSVTAQTPTLRGCEAKWLTGNAYGPGTFSLSYSRVLNGKIVPYTPSLQEKLSQTGDFYISAASMWTVFKKFRITSYDLVGESILYKMALPTRFLAARYLGSWLFPSYWYSLIQCSNSHMTALQAASLLMVPASCTSPGNSGFT